MNLPAHILKRKLTTLLLFTVSIAAFATLGDGNKKDSAKNRTLLSYKPSYNYKNFSLKTGYNYRGISIFKQSKATGKFIKLNSVVTYHKGNTTYITPLKKKFLSGKVVFKPTVNR